MLCLDGTGNQYSDRPTNVQLLYECLDESDGQIAYYDAGVGTFELGTTLTSLARKVQLALGLAFGYGLKQNVLDAYEYLVRNYDEGDLIFIFGFSRGAYTARVVAAMVKAFGILGRDHLNLLPYALAKLDNSDGTYPDFRELAAFKRAFSDHSRATVHYLGIWDTVASVSWAFRRQQYVYTRHNDAVEVIRHAVSLDERRAFFRTNRVQPAKNQDVREVWFAGVHSDVGGGYRAGASPENEGVGLSRLALEWMLVQASKHGLALDDVGVQTTLYEAGDKPDPLAPRHRSLVGPWWACELWPKRVWDGWLPSLNLARPRSVERYQVKGESPVQDRSISIHASLDQRMAAGYMPPNLRREDVDRNKIEPWEPWANLQDPVEPEKPASGNARFLVERSLGSRIAGALAGSASVALLFSLVVTVLIVIPMMLWEHGLIEAVTGALLWIVWAPFLPLERDYLFGTALCFLWPIIFFVGSRVCRQGLARERSKAHGPLLHLRPGGYSAKDIERFLSAIDGRGLENYAAALRRDFAFIAIYALGFYWVWELAGATHQWMLVLLLFGVVADVVENSALLAVITRYRVNQSVPKMAAWLARIGTTLKFLGLFFAVLVLQVHASGVITNFCTGGLGDSSAVVQVCGFLESVEPTWGM